MASRFQRISRNVIVRNVVLAICAIVVFTALAAFALDIFTRHSRQEPVPDFVGVHISEVERVADRAGLRVEITDSIYAPVHPGGTVVEQQPESGKEVKKGRRIFVTITSHQQKMVGVPFVTGFGLRQAKNMIELAGLEVGELRYVENIATNNVLAELIGRDTVYRTSDRKLEVGSGVTLVVGRAPDAAWVKVPNVVGLSLSRAKSLLWERGFNVGEVSRDKDINLMNQDNARVYRQLPTPGREVELGTRVSMSLTLDETQSAQ